MSKLLEKTDPHSSSISEVFNFERQAYLHVY